MFCCRFPDTDMMCAFSVLAMRPISILGDDEIVQWGNDSIKQLTDFYGNDQHHTDPDGKVTDSEALDYPLETEREWQSAKLLVRDQQYPRTSLLSLWEIMLKFHGDEFPNLLKLVQLALLHPVHTSDVERAFSKQNLITTPLRSCLNDVHCDHLMRIMIEGTAFDKFPFTSAVEKWRAAKQRTIFSSSKTK